jgi:hypothetical protein
MAHGARFYPLARGRVTRWAQSTKVRRVGTALAIVALIAGCGGHQKPKPPPPPAPAPGLGDFVGIYSDDVFFGDDAYKSATLARERQAGIGLIRQPFAWSDFERDPQPFDAFVGAAARDGIRVLPVVLGPEPGAAPATGGMAPPRDVSTYAAYAAALENRYGPQGSFWSSHGDVPKLPIRSWQIWNEPNIPAFWASGPDPAAYAKLLEAAGRAIREIDPHAEIVTAGLPTSHLGVPAAKFLQGMYDAGASGAFDEVAVHAYAHTPAGVLNRASEAKQVIDRNGDNARLWITEFGWGTGGKPGPLTVTDDQQAKNIADTIALLNRERQHLHLRGFVVFQWRDPKPFPGRRDIWPYYAGLLDANGNPKPSLAAFEKAVSAR